MSQLPPVQLTGGPRCLVSQDADLAGTITLGAGCIVHPRAVVYALHGPIILGHDCIVEETAIILNRRKEPMVIGHSNLFEVGSRVECASIGDHNTFEPRARVSALVRISDWCTVGASCLLLPNLPKHTEEMPRVVPVEGLEADDVDFAAVETASSLSDKDECELLPPQTMVYGAQSQRRHWSGEGKDQAMQLHDKHLTALRELFQRAFKARTVQPLAEPTEERLKDTPEAATPEAS